MEMGDNHIVDLRVQPMMEGEDSLGTELFRIQDKKQQLLDEQKKLHKRLQEIHNEHQLLLHRERLILQQMMISAHSFKRPRLNDYESMQIKEELAANEMQFQMINHSQDDDDEEAVDDVSSVDQLVQGDLMLDTNHLYNFPAYLLKQDLQDIPIINNRNAASGLNGQVYEAEKNALNAKAVVDVSAISQCPSSERVNEKETLLRPSRVVERLVGVRCEWDPVWCRDLLLKHAPHLEELELWDVGREHLQALESMPKLRRLTVLGYNAELESNPVRFNPVLDALAAPRAGMRPRDRLKRRASGSLGRGLLWLVVRLPLQTALSLISAHRLTLREVELFAPTNWGGVQLKPSWNSLHELLRWSLHGKGLTGTGQGIPGAPGPGPSHSTQTFPMSGNEPPLTVTLRLAREQSAAGAWAGAAAAGGAVVIQTHSSGDCAAQLTPMRTALRGADVSCRECKQAQINGVAVLDALNVEDISRSGPREKRSEKDALLRSDKPAHRLLGVECLIDPMWSSRLLQKHARYVVELNMVDISREHLLAVRNMPALRRLAICRWNGDLESNPVQFEEPVAGSVRGLSWLQVWLPQQSVINLICAHRHTLQEVILSVGTPQVLPRHAHAHADQAAKWPRSSNSLPQLLAPLGLQPGCRVSLHRHRTFTHGLINCQAQLDSVRRAVPGVIVSCSTCSSSSSISSSSSSSSSAPALALSSSSSST